jgi:hypothetical protein
MIEAPSQWFQLWRGQLQGVLSENMSLNVARIVRNGVDSLDVKVRGSRNHVQPSKTSFRAVECMSRDSSIMDLATEDKFQRH